MCLSPVHAIGWEFISSCSALFMIYIHSPWSHVCEEISLQSIANCLRVLWCPYSMGKSITTYRRSNKKKNTNFASIIK